MLAALKTAGPVKARSLFSVSVFWPERTKAVLPWMRPDQRRALLSWLTTKAARVALELTTVPAEPGTLLSLSRDRICWVRPLRSSEPAVRARKLFGWMALSAKRRTVPSLITIWPL